MKQYEDILFEILSLDVEDVIRTSFGVDEEKEDVGEMPEFPFVPGI